MHDYFDKHGKPLTRAAIYSGCYSDRHYAMGKPRLERMVNLLGDGPHGRLLDVGCGRAELVHRLTDAGHDAIGCEIVPELCDGGRVQHVPDITDLPYAYKEFDTVVCCDVLEHIAPEDTEAAVRELARVCKRRLVVHVAWFTALRKIGNTTVELHCNKRDDWQQVFEAVEPWQSTHYEYVKPMQATLDMVKN